MDKQRQTGRRPLLGMGPLAGEEGKEAKKKPTPKM
jgi:hypothetical protein